MTIKAIDDLNEQDQNSKINYKSPGEYAELRASEKESENLAKNKGRNNSKEIRMIAEVVTLYLYALTLISSENKNPEQEKIEHGIRDQIRDFSYFRNITANFACYR